MNSKNYMAFKSVMGRLHARLTMGYEATHFGRYDSWGAALEDAGTTYVEAKVAKGGGSAWDHGAVHPVERQTSKVQDRLLHYLAFLNLNREDCHPSQVLDYGGGRGFYAQLVHQLGVLDRGSRWTIVDVPSVVHQFPDNDFIKYRLESEISGPYSHVCLGAVLQIIPEPFVLFERLRALRLEAWSGG